jgi:hypothetical protein
MIVTVSGATGFIGRELVRQLSADGHSVRALSRNPSGKPSGTSGETHRWDPREGEPPESSLAGSDAVVHLAGEPVAQRWTTEVKERIRESRVRGTRHLVQALTTLSPRPRVLVCSSAIGIYGDREDEVLTESSAPGQGFLARVCRDWEEQADLAQSLGLRVVKLRTGIVLGRNGGALEQMLPPFRYGVGGKLASGRQWMSWIHLHDQVSLIRYALEQPVSGAVNAVAPNPATNAEFTRELAGALKRPALFTVPGFALKLLYGEMAEVLLGSQRVIPAAAQAGGFEFKFPTLPGALADILGSR